MPNNIDITLRTKLAHIQAILETVAENPEGAPSGVCYMAMQMHGVDIETYQGYIDGLTKAGLITNRGHLLRPTKKALKLLKLQ